MFVLRIRTRIILWICSGVVVGVFGVFCFFRDHAGEASWRDRATKENLTEGEFTQIYLEALRQRVPEVEARIVGDLEITAKKGDWEHHIFLGNLWTRCCEETGGRVDLIEYYLEGFVVSRLRSSGESAVAIDSVIPVIKDSVFLADVGVGDDGTKPYYGEVLAGDIWIIYAEDEDSGIAYLNEKQGKELGLSFDELRITAKKNLKRMLGKVECHGTGEVFMIAAGGTYEASLLLFESIWEEQGEIVEGDVVAAIPARDMLLFTGSECEEGLRKLREVSERVFAEAPYAISKTLLVRKNGSWSVFDESHKNVQ